MQNTKKMYRIELVRHGGIAEDIAVLAALSNGSGKYISLKDMESIAKVDLIRFPTLYDGITVNLIGENCLTIDKLTQNLLVLSEVQVMELIEEDVPTLSRYKIG